jgi:hypothetical protein
LWFRNELKKTFTKTELNERTKLIAEYCLEEMVVLKAQPPTKQQLISLRA